MNVNSGSKMQEGTYGYFIAVLTDVCYMEIEQKNKNRGNLS